MESKRYLDNPYPDYVDGVAGVDEKTLLSNVEKHLNSALIQLYKKCPPTTEYCEESNGDLSVDLSNYLGTFGNVYIQWRLYEMHKHKEEQKDMKECLGSALDAFKVNEKLCLKYNKPEEWKRSSPSFFMGQPGLYTLGAILYRESKETKEMERCFKEVLRHLELCKLPHSEDELLYGNAGYLYCLLLLYKTDPVIFECKEAIIEVVNLLKKYGEKTIDGNKVLNYTFPRNKGRAYCGGAHGTFGVVYILLEAIDIVKDLTKDGKLMMLLENSCDLLVSIQFPSGNFPNIFGSKNEELVHFCHGAPGMIPTLLAAHMAFKKEVYLTSALAAGEVVWNRGILLKGNSLCHGTAGNAYFLHTLYRFTKNPLWHHRFASFLDATWNEKIREVVENYEDMGRKVKGTPDTPYSLMEGMGGTVVLYADVISGQMAFPGYEL